MNANIAKILDEDLIAKGVEKDIEELCVLGQMPLWLHPFRRIAIICDKLTAHYTKAEHEVTKQEWEAVDQPGRRVALFLLARESKKNAQRIAKRLKKI